MSERNGGWILTYTGRQFWPLDPRPEDVEIMDIAHALSNVCRYTGHCSQFYSVAQHSVLVSRYCANPLWGLLHDAGEAYLADVARPVKPGIVNLKEIENGLMQAVASRFSLSWPEPHDVKAVDTRILMDERRVLMVGGAEWNIQAEPLGIDVVPVGPVEARQMFLDRYYELKMRGVK
jgi:5'-nucleotidase